MHTTTHEMMRASTTTKKISAPATNSQGDTISNTSCKKDANNNRKHTASGITT
jgi:hypothetical protein